jgi:ParB family chromosome partitioning protein
MQNSSEFQYIAIDQLFESPTNPRQTFDQKKLEELAESIRTGGLIQPIVVRPKDNRFEIVAGARRFRAGQLAEQFSLPARIKELTDAQAMEWQLVENSQRVDVHPYQEAQGFQRLLDLPGYDVAALVEKSGKSASHIYARLSLLQLIPEVAEAFTQERITASHANLIARIPQESQAEAFEQCWRKDWKDDEAHLLPAKFLSAWIQSNLYLSLADAPFDREDHTLNPAAGACTTCPGHSGYNTSLFLDVTDGDQCLDGKCFRTKISEHIDREIAARPDLIQIETVIENPDAEPASACAAARTAIIVYGKRIGTTTTVCTDNSCPVHDPQAAEEQAANPAPKIAPAPEAETDEEAEERQRNYEQQRKEYEEEQERRAEVRKLEEEQREQEYEAERARKEELQKARTAAFERIVQNAPATFTSAQLRVLLRALVNLDPYTLTDDLAEQIAGEDENEQRTAEEVLLSAIDGLEDNKLTGFALRLALTGHIDIPREGEFDFLAEAEAVFASPQPKNAASKKPKVKTPTPIKAASKPAPKKAPAKKKTAA